MDDFYRALSEKKLQVIRDQNITLVLAENLNYSAFLEVQELATQYIKAYRQSKVFILCNHPTVYTLGSGNERGVDSLMSFKEDNTSLNHPLYRIRRGGGITLHHRGQINLYTVMALSPSYNLNDHSCEMLKWAKSIFINHLNITDVLATSKLMGVWHRKQKIASIGVGSKSFVTQHGIALNICKTEESASALALISPCGLESKTYTFASEVLKKEINVSSLMEQITAQKSNFSSFFQRRSSEKTVLI